MEFIIFNILLIFIIFTYAVARESRHLVFPDSAIYKLVLGIGVPIDVERKGTYVSWLANVQVMYKLPENIKFLEQSALRDGKSMKDDFTGRMLYEALNNTFVKYNLPETEAFYKFMCELEELRTSESAGLLQDVLQVLMLELASSRNTRTNSQHIILDFTSMCTDMSNDN